MKKYYLAISTALAFFTNANAQQATPVQDRWAIQQDGSILWQVKDRLPHEDHIEMSGQKVSLWLQYGVDESKKPSYVRTFVYPTFRLLPARTISSMMYSVDDENLPRILLNDKLMKKGVYNATVMEDQPEKTATIRFDGMLTAESSIGKDGSIILKRSFFPSVDKALAVEKLVFINKGSQAAKIEMEYMRREVRPAPERASEGPLRFIVATVGDGLKTVAPGDSVVFGISYQAIAGAATPLMDVNINKEEAARQERVKEITSLLQLETPDRVLNTMFYFAKIRGTESIYNTKGGFMHSPGGLRYYAAIWANDQAEYVNPFFAFLGDKIGTKSAMNAYRLFAGYMNPEYKPIPSSIIDEGRGTWHGAGDRGDMAMIAYGAGRFALANGSADSARVLWPLIEWCLEYCKRKINDEGVVWSNRDELEGRFPSGNANLNTSCLYYDGLVSAAMLAKALGKPAAQVKGYTDQAAQMRINIEKYFGATVEGFKTYRYYKGNDTLRAWIATPLVMDLFDRKQGTIDALFSERLWTADGLASLAGNKTFWDRATLYGLRGAFAAGETTKAYDFLKYYSERRLLGEHVPYAVEAYPEGNQRHLSAESGLYCRIFTEGVLGMRPTGFRSFNFTPNLPAAWNYMRLKNIHAFGTVFNIEVVRKKGSYLTVKVSGDGKDKTYAVKEGKTIAIQL
ncbi:hypothetical protein [Niabella soli]|uniref:Six-hairpin glycosidase-like protein n=1 Tax=Niabella soli DSM 19437 TaxID=929713 RepID=W0F2H0_9BACT|nr:hypothetical protein [Niabella soli]AHF15536.1 hypothetical protein NIASO_10940 [Niabella soli DSM 19437]